MGKEYVIAEVKFCISSVPLVSVVITRPPGLLKRKKKITATKTSLFFPPNFNVYINLDNGKRVRARNK